MLEDPPPPPPLPWLNSGENCRYRSASTTPIIPIAIKFKSPISDTNIVFYNTLFDENASCHLALGASYTTTNLKDADKYTEEELDEEGSVITPEQHIITDYREDTFRFPIPRADKNEDALSLPARLRGKYMICDYELDSDIDHTFKIP